MFLTDLQAKQALRSSLIRNLQSLISSEDPSSEVVVSWVNLLSSMCQNADELSADSGSLIVSILGNATNAIKALHVPYDEISGLLSAISSLASISKITTLSDGTLMRRRLLDTSATHEIAQMAEAFGQIALSQMTIGQKAVQAVQPTFRMVTVATLVNNDGVSTFSAPQTTLESSTGLIAPSISITPISSSSSTSSSSLTTLAMTMVVTPAAYYANSDANASQLVSNPVRVSIDCSQPAMANRLIHFTLPYNEAQVFGVNTSAFVQTFTTLCRKRWVESFFYKCPGVDTPMQVDCDGLPQTLVSKCPQPSRVPMCQLLSSSNSGPSQCTVQNDTSSSTSTTCACYVCTASSSLQTSAAGGRRALGSDEAENAVTEIAATTTYVATQFSTIAQSAASFNSASSILQTITLIIAYAVVWLCVPALVLLHDRYYAKEGQEGNMKTRKKKNAVGSLRVSVSAAALETPKHENDVAQKMDEYVTSLIPVVFKEQHKTPNER